MQTLLKTTWYPCAYFYLRDTFTNKQKHFVANNHVCLCGHTNINWLRICSSQQQDPIRHNKATLKETRVSVFVFFAKCDLSHWGDLHWLLTNKYITRVHCSLMLYSSNCVEE